MVLDRWDPFRELRRMEETMDRLWSNVGRQVGYPSAGPDAWAIPLDVVQQGDSVIVHAALPGVKPEDISVTVEDSVLTIKGETHQERVEKDATYLLRERRSGSFVRSIRLPDSVDGDRAESSYVQGVLTITFPKLEAKRVKQVKVQVTEQPREERRR